MSDEQDFERILEVVYPRARAIALLLCRNRDAAEDLVQEALLAALRRPPAPLTEDVLAAWLRTTIFRLFVRRWRRAAREARAILRLGRERAPAAMEGPAAETVDALNDLSPRQRVCVLLRYLEDLPEEEVARALGMRLGTVKAHLAQARKRLRERLGPP